MKFFALFFTFISLLSLAFSLTLRKSSSALEADNKTEYKSLDNNTKTDLKSLDNNTKTDLKSLDNNTKTDLKIDNNTKTDLKIDNNTKTDLKSLDNNTKTDLKSLDNNTKTDLSNQDNNTKTDFQNKENNTKSDLFHNKDSNYTYIPLRGDANSTSNFKETDSILINSNTDALSSETTATNDPNDSLLFIGSGKTQASLQEIKTQWKTPSYVGK